MESLNLLEKKTNGTVKIIKQQYDTIINNSIYSGIYNFKLNHSYGSLKQLFIKATLSTGGNATTLKTPFGALLLSSIILRSDSSVLQRITPVYTTARLDLLANTGLYQKILPGVQPPTGNFSSGSNTCIVYIPLFFWFSDKTELALDLYGRRQLYLEITTNSSNINMGMSAALTSSTYELISVFEQKETYSVPKQIKGSYDVFLEDTQQLAIGATSCRFRLRCPNEVFSISMMLIVPATLAYLQINSVQIDIPTSTLFSIDYQMNYLLSDDPNKSYNQTSSTTLTFGSRNVKDTFLTFSQNMAPTYITVNFTALTASTNLYTISEYHTELESLSDGFINTAISGVF